MGDCWTNPGSRGWSQNSCNPILWHRPRFHQILKSILREPISWTVQCVCFYVTLTCLSTSVSSDHLWSDFTPSLYVQNNNPIPIKTPTAAETTRRSHSGTLRWRREGTSSDVFMVGLGESQQEFRPQMTPIFNTKVNTRVGTWNVWTVFQCDPKTIRDCFDILGVSEMRWTGQGSLVCESNCSLLWETRPPYPWGRPHSLQRYNTSVDWMEASERVHHHSKSLH